MCNTCELFVSFYLDTNGTLKNGEPCKLVVVESSVINECVIKVFAEKLFFNEHLANSCNVLACVKDYMLLSKQDKDDGFCLANKCIVKVEAFEHEGSTHQLKLLEIDGKVANENEVYANAELVWLKGDVIGKECKVVFSTKLQKNCFQAGMVGASIAQDATLKPITLESATTNPILA